MKACDRHWQMFRTAIAERGLEGRIARSGAEAAADLEAGRPDPLLSAYLMIVELTVRVIGPGVLSDGADGSEKCPVCTLSAFCQCGRLNCCDDYVGKCADLVLQKLTEARA